MFTVSNWNGKSFPMGMRNIYPSYWEKITLPTEEHFSFPFPVGNFLSSNWEMFHTFTRKGFPFPLKNVHPSQWETFFLQNWKYICFQLPCKKTFLNRYFSYLLYSKCSSLQKAWIRKTGDSSQTGPNRETFPRWFIHEFWKIFTPGGGRAQKRTFCGTDATRVFTHWYSATNF